jgi:hypothetical protein
LLLDGPKEFAANRLSLVASILFPLVAVGHHNAEAGISWTDQFGRFFPGAFHYEQLQDGEDIRWTAFKTWEREFVHGYEVPGTPGRSLSRSSLALATIPAGHRPASALLAIDGLGSRTSAFRTLFKWQRLAAGVTRRAR